MTKRRKKTAEEYTFLSIDVGDYSVRSEAALNYNLKQSHPTLYQDDDPAFEFITTLVVSGICRYPPDRKDDYYEITFMGGEFHAGHNSLTLKDYQARDKHGVPVYKEYRGESLPVFDSPPGLATLNKRRGENKWDSWICVKQELVRDMLTTLAHIKPVYLSIQELKSNRQRWIQSVTLQSTIPEEE